MLPVDAWRVVPCDLVPWLAILHRAGRGERQRGCLRRSIPSRLPAHLGPVQFGLHFGKVFFDFPSNLNLCHRAPDLVISRRKVQTCQVAVDLCNRGFNGAMLQVREPWHLTLGSSRQRYVKCHRKLRLTLVLLSFQAFRTPRFEGKNTALISGAELKYVEDGNGLLT
jgi:hypothetical protein